MRRRMVGLVASLALAAFGTLVLVGYAQSAHDRAAAAVPTTRVLVVTARVAKGTKAGDLTAKVKSSEIPTGSKIAGAVTDLAQLQGKVAVTDLLPGEQVLSDRFQTPQVLGRAGVPDGLLEVTVELDPERALGGGVKAGDTVAVLASFAPFELEAAGVASDPNAPKKTPNTTDVILHKVLVTHVQASTTGGGSSASKDKTTAKDDAKPDPAPTGTLLVTLALDAPSVERVVFTAEYGKLWLSAEPADAPEGGTQTQTRGSIYR